MDVGVLGSHHNRTTKWGSHAGSRTPGAQIRRQHRRRRRLLYRRPGNDDRLRRRQRRGQNHHDGSTVSYDLLEEAAVDAGLATIVAIVFAFLFYLSSILFGMSIAQSVVEEKQNRIVEILASAIPVRQLLIGKVAGNTVLAFAQLTLFIVAGLLGLAATGRGGQVAQIAGAAGWFIVFFVVGFLALAGLWAVAGSLATRSEDLQSTATPMTMFVMIVLFAGIFLSGTARVVASYVPIVSIVAMPARLAEGTAAWWEPIIALALMAAATYGIVLVAEKVYRRSLMQTQRRLTFRQALAVED